MRLNYELLLGVGHVAAKGCRYGYSQFPQWVVRQAIECMWGNLTDWAELQDPGGEKKKQKCTKTQQKPGDESSE